MNQHSIFNNSIMNTFQSHLVLNLELEQARHGIVQELNRNVMLGTLYIHEGKSRPLPSGSKSIGPRKLHNLQYGFVCPTG